MQPFTCPQCGHKSSFDPWTETAHCAECGFRPPAGGSKQDYIRWAQRHAYQPFLDELRAHWDGTHTPDPAFTLESAQDAVDFFQEYQRSMGEDPRMPSGPHVQYTRDYQPTHREILILAGAYLHLRRGKRAQAAEDLEALLFHEPKFVDAWVWLSATTDDVEARREHLEQAARYDAGHPLARDALALMRGKGSPRRGRQEEKVVVAQCPKCGGGLRYEPGLAEVTCPYCSHAVALKEANVVDGTATPIHDLRLQRRYEGHTWAEAERIVHCRACGAALTMSHHLAQRCAFCGSTNVLLEDNRRVLEQPDGLLPFQFSQQQAAEAVAQAQSSGWRGVKAWWSGKAQEMVDLQGVYLPFWVFDGIVEIYHFRKTWSTESKETLKWQAFENLPLSAVETPDPALLKKVYPFDLRASVPYEPRLLADWQARLYSRDVEMVGEDARHVMVKMARKEAPRVAPARSRGSDRTESWLASAATPTLAAGQQIAFQVVGITYQLLLLPVWLAPVVCDGERSLAIVNGQTGRVAFGPAPGDDGEVAGGRQESRGL